MDQVDLEDAHRSIVARCADRRSPPARAHQARGDDEGPNRVVRALVVRVDLSGQLSKTAPALVRMLAIEKPQVKRQVRLEDQGVTTSRQVRLSRHQQAELVERYQAGALRRELAAAYGIGTGTVSGILKRHGVARTKGLTTEQIDDAVRRYTAGDSLAAIGAALGLTAHTVRTRLLERGVQMRSAAGVSR